MAFLGMLVPFVAAAGWLWWIYRADRFEKEPWSLVLQTFGLGALAGLITMILLLVLAVGAGSFSGFLLVPVQVATLYGAIVLLPYRRPDWNEPFDGIVYGGAAGVGFGLVYTLILMVANGPVVGFRTAMFSMPVYMMAGLILGHYLSEARFAPSARPGRLKWRGIWITLAYLFGLELAQAMGGEVMGMAHPFASMVVYAANTIGWVLAMYAMESRNKESQYNPGNYRLQMAPAPCPHCGHGYAQGGSFCNTCGRPVAHMGVQV